MRFLITFSILQMSARLTGHFPARRDETFYNANKICEGTHKVRHESDQAGAEIRGIPGGFLIEIDEEACCAHTLLAHIHRHAKECARSFLTDSRCRYATGSIKPADRSGRIRFCGRVAAGRGKVGEHKTRLSPFRSFPDTCLRVRECVSYRARDILPALQSD